MSESPGDQPNKEDRHSEPLAPPGDGTEAGSVRDGGPAFSMDDELDREVADAMSAMAPEDLAELSGDVVPDAARTVPTKTGEADQPKVKKPVLTDRMESDPAPEPGAELIGTVVAVSDDDVFLEFSAKSQGVMPRSQFGKKEVISVGREVDVVVDRFDPSGGILLVNRKGALQRATWTNLTKGMMVRGRVTGVIKGGLEVMVNGLRAFMPASQADVIPRKDISELLNETIQCEVIEFDRRNKNILVSRRRILEHERAEAREKLKAELEVGQIRPGVVGTIMEYGAFIDLGGIDGLAHIRDLSWGSVDRVQDVLTEGQKVEVKILKIEKERDRISLGVKQVQPDPWSCVPEKFPVGTSLKARVVRIVDFGVFVELEPGVDGLIPISEMGWTRIHKASDLVCEGDLVDAVVIRVEPERRRLALSMKQAQADPWSGLDGFEDQSLVKGTVTRLADFGAFVELVPGVEGLVHISELADRRVKSCSDVVRVGEEVEARILSMDRKNRRVSLSLKAVASPTDAEATGPETPPTPVKTKKRKKRLRGGLASHYDW